MSSYSHEQALEEIRQYIDDHCIFRCDPNIQYSLAAPKGKLPARGFRKGGLSWLMMLRRLTHNPKMMYLVASLISEEILRRIVVGEEYSTVQLAGLETSSIPIITAIQQRMLQRNIAINAFSIRKERKHYDLFNWIDGKPIDDVPVIFIDDILSSGKSLRLAIDICHKELKLRPAKNTYCIVSFNHNSHIEYEESKINIVSLFYRDQFTFKFDKDRYWLPKDCVKEDNSDIQMIGVHNESEQTISVDREIQATDNKPSDSA